MFRSAMNISFKIDWFTSLLFGLGCLVGIGFYNQLGGASLIVDMIGSLASHPIFFVLLLISIILVGTRNIVFGKSLESVDRFTCSWMSKPGMVAIIGMRVLFAFLAGLVIPVSMASLEWGVLISVFMAIVAVSMIMSASLFSFSCRESSPTEIDGLFFKAINAVIMVSAVGIGYSEYYSVII